jgi:MerR family transcriptional regulator, light-induced transcriptional regulator
MNLHDDHSQVMHSIAAVERDTGIGKDTLRVWERRYSFPVPSRDANGERIYPKAQVEKLRVIKRLMDQGHRPGRIVGQSVEALQHLSRGESSLQPVYRSFEMRGRENLDAYIAMLQAQDVDGLRHAFLKKLEQDGLERFVMDVAAPLTVMVGDAWARGELAVHQEHLFTECVSNLMRQGIAAIPKAAGAAAPCVLLTTFPQEAHRLGLLMAECLLTLDGCRCVSLGTQTPVDEIAQAAVAHHVDVVVLSFSANMNPNHIAAGLKELNSLMPFTIEVWVGGQALALRRRAIGRVLVLRDLKSIGEAVSHWRQRRQ